MREQSYIQLLRGSRLVFVEEPNSEHGYINTANVMTTLNNHPIVQREIIHILSTSDKNYQVEVVEMQK